MTPEHSLEPLSLLRGQVDGTALPGEGGRARGQPPSSSYKVDWVIFESVTKPHVKSSTHAPHREDFAAANSAGAWAYNPGNVGRRGAAEGPRPQPTPVERLKKQLPDGGAAPGADSRRRERPGRAAAPGPRAARLPGRLAPRGRRAWGRGGRACGLLGDFSPGLACGSRPGPRPLAPGSRTPRRDSPERPGSASWCPSGCPCLCSDSTWCSSPPRRRLQVALRDAGVTFKAGRQARGDAGGGAAPGQGWGAGRPLGSRGDGGGGGSGGSGSGCSDAAGGLRWRGGSAGSPSRPALLPLSRSSAMAAAAATDKHLTAQAERRRPPPPSPPPPERDEIRPRGWRGEEGGRRAGE